MTMCKELFKFARAAQRPDKPLLGTKSMQWYFFYVAAFWIYLRQVRGGS
jgi:hypothetical protein